MVLRKKILIGICIIGLIVYFMCIGNINASLIKSKDTKGSSTADHTKFEELQKPFKTGPEVTKACLACHTEAAEQVQHTIHWRWETGEKELQGLGKAHYLNNL